jgi:hypothetical protein
MSFEALQQHVVQVFVAKWSSFKIAGDAKRNLESGIMSIAAYCEMYRSDLATFELEDIETSQGGY